MPCRRTLTAPRWASSATRRAPRREHSGASHDMASSAADALSQWGRATVRPYAMLCYYEARGVRKAAAAMLEEQLVPAVATLQRAVRKARQQLR